MVIYRVEFAILGPLEVRLDEVLLALGGPKQRAVLALLLFDANQVVSRDRLIEGLWGAAPPPTATRNIDSYVSRLRGILGGDRIERRAPGYMIRVQPGELDLDRFDGLVEQGRRHRGSGETAAAAAAFKSALDLWRGEALADLVYEPFAADVTRWLEDRRVGAFEEFFDAELALGHGGAALSDLEQLVREHPYRERLLGEYLVALYQAGRQAEALAAYQAARQAHATELGLELGPELTELHRRILEHDASLGGTGPGPSPVHRDPPARLRPRLGAVVVAAVVTLGVVLAAAVGIARNGQTRASTGGNQALEVSSASSEPVRLDGTPTAMVPLDHSLWLADPSRGALDRIDLESHAVVDRVPLTDVGLLASGDGAVWASEVSGGNIFRVDPQTGSVTQTIRLGRARASALAFGENALWVADATGGALIEIRPSTGRPERVLALSLHPTALTVGNGTIWVADYDAGLVAQVDARSGQTLATTRVGGGPAALAADADGVWVANGLDATVSKIESATSAVVATIPVGSGPTAVGVAGGSVWVTSEYAQVVSRIDAGKLAVVDTTPVPGGPIALAVSGPSVWAAVRPLTAHRGGTLTLLHTRPISVDPALHVDLLPPVSDGLTRDGLVTYNQVAGAAGTRLVPDLALAIPAAGDAGRTYTFRLRPGIEYSNGQPVRAADFRRALERVFNLHSPGRDSFTSIVGSVDCEARESAPCSLSRGIVTDDRARTITFRLRAPDPAFLANLTTAGLATPVPRGTPMDSTPADPIPGTGPYMIESASSTEIRYARNPRFHEWSHAAKPDGNPDRIVMRLGVPPDRAVAEVLKGEADWVTEAIPPSSLPGLSRRHARQLHGNDAPLTAFLRLDTTRPPFDDVRVRRALNFAIDRAAVVRLKGGPTAATTTCQLLPPGISGYRRYCPFTRNPRRDGAWTAPDLSEAKRLVAASGTRGTVIPVAAVESDPEISPAVARLVTATLRRLGYRPRLCLLRADLRDPPAGCAPEKLLVGPASWADGYAYGFFGPWVSCAGAQNGAFCDRNLDRRMQRVRTLEATDPHAAAIEWEQIDREVSDRGVLVPLVTPRVVDLVSTRVENYQFHPYWGVLASQIWFD